MKCHWICVLPKIKFERRFKFGKLAKKDMETFLAKFCTVN